MKNKIIYSLILSFIYIIIGTYDNLTGLKIESYITNFFCEKGSPKCELLIMLFYSPSYFPSRMLSAFFNSNDIIFILFQLLMLFLYSTFILLFLNIIYKISVYRKQSWAFLICDGFLANIYLCSQKE